MALNLANGTMARLTYILTALILLTSTIAMADHKVMYHAYHPIPQAYGDGFCYAKETHAHEYAPVDLEQYNVIDGVYHFIGDPTWYEYDETIVEELVWYEYHHPVPTLWGGGYCYIWGPHRHWWRPHHHRHHHHYVVVNHRHVYKGPWGKTYRPKKRIVAPYYRKYKAKKKKSSWQGKSSGAKSQKWQSKQRNAARQRSGDASSRPARRGPRAAPPRNLPSRPRAAPRRSSVRRMSTPRRTHSVVPVVNSRRPAYLKRRTPKKNSSRTRTIRRGTRRTRR